MKINWEFDFTSYTAKDVFLTFRDCTLKFAKYLPNVKKVEILEKKRLDKTRTLLITKWYGVGKIPPLIRSIIKPDMIAWKEEDIYDEQKLVCSWKIEPFYFKEFFKCYGKWIFKDESKGSSKAIIDGILTVYIPSFPGVPDVIAQKAGKIIEQIIFRYLGPNLKKTIGGIKKLLDEG